MTDLFNQFGGALADFKMRNIDSASLHEIIGEFAPLIGVATDGFVAASVSKKADNNINTPPVETVIIKTEIKQEKKDLEYVNGNTCVKPIAETRVVTHVKQIAETHVEKGGMFDIALDLSMKPRATNETKDVLDIKPVLNIKSTVDVIQRYSIKREPEESTKIDHSIYKKARQTFDSPKLESRNSCSPVLNDSANVESPQSSTKSNRDSDDESSKVSKLLYEVKTVNDLKYYQCKLCPKVYDTKYHLNRHLISHGGNRPHICDKCGKSFAQKCDLNRHLNVHNNLRKHACSVCGKTFKRADYLSKHERQYCGVYKPHKCTKCFKGFEELEQLAEHSCIQRMDGSTFTCEHCGEKFETVDNLVEHRKTHKNKEEDYQCTKCNEQFTNFASYVDHFKVRNEKLYLT